MPKLWLTYAWRDNETNQVDFIISRLRAAGIEVGFDRAHLQAGRRLWEQLDQAIQDPTLDGWAIYVTEASLRSEPCQEEIAYALDRALRTRGSNFPLVGIFPEQLDRSIIPSSLATRLYVDLQDPDWLERIVATLQHRPPVPGIPSMQPWDHAWYRAQGKIILEVWPRAGRWTDCQILITPGEGGRLVDVSAAAQGTRFGGEPLLCSRERLNLNGESLGWLLHAGISSVQSVHVQFNEMPSAVLFGPRNNPDLEPRGVWMIMTATDPKALALPPETVTSGPRFL